MNELDQYEVVIAKHREKISEVEACLRDLSNEDQVSYTSEQIQKLAKSGAIPKELWDYHCRSLKNAYDKSEGFRKFKEANKHLSEEELLKQFFPSMQLSINETIKFYEDAALGNQFLKFLLQNKHLLSKEQDAGKQTNQSLFDGIDVVEEFGIANCISNSLYHLSELLKTMEVSEVYPGLYEAKSSVKNTKGEAISLIYTFPAQNIDDAKSILKTYQSTMATKGLKVWIAHWITANRLGRVEYSCPMIDIMKMAADEEREAFFSVKEKEEHWALTKMLGMSKLLRERKIRKRGTSTQVIQWVEQPLVAIIGGEKELTAEDKYPVAVAVRVLMPRMDKKGFSPTIYKNKTVVLSPSDMLLAFVLQTRAGQMGRGTKNLHYDWDFIFEVGNLQTTALSNHRGAKAKARKKMDRLQEGEIIENWNEELMGVCVTPKKAKKEGVQRG